MTAAPPRTATLSQMLDSGTGYQIDTKGSLDDDAQGSSVGLILGAQTDHSADAVTMELNRRRIFDGQYPE